MCITFEKALRVYSSLSHSFPSGMRLPERSSSINIDLECRQCRKELKKTPLRHVTWEKNLFGKTVRYWGWLLMQHNLTRPWLIQWNLFFERFLLTKIYCLVSCINLHFVQMQKLWFHIFNFIPIILIKALLI